MERDHIVQQSPPSPGQPLKARGAPYTAGIHGDINTATRRQHARLNRQILEHIPLALPPAASGPSIYGQGIAAFAEIYYAFEQVWDDLIAAGDGAAVSNDSHESRVLSWLATLRPPGLVRSRRLEQDLQHVYRCTGTDPSTSSRACEHITRRMRAAIRKRPHTLVAYAWVMYMALFSGGRVIRQMLARAGPGFWSIDGVPKAVVDLPGQRRREALPLETAGFSFLCFDDGKDGTQIKAEFKSRLADGEGLLSEKERQDIIHASVLLFDDCVALVRALDGDILPRKARWTWTRRAALTVAICALIAGMLWAVGYLRWSGIAVDFGHTDLQRLLMDWTRRFRASVTYWG